MAEGAAQASQAGAEGAAKPAILQDQAFIVEEGLAYRACRTGAIWTNKLFFSSCVLLVVWLLWSYSAGDAGCVPDAAGGGHCSVWLNPTSVYLGGMAILSFVLSIGFGLLGLMVGKKVIEATRAEDEVGARR